MSEKFTKEEWMDYIYLCYKTSKFELFYTAFLIPYIAYQFYTGEYEVALTLVWAFMFIVRGVLSAVGVELLRTDLAVLMSSLRNFKKKLKELSK